MQKWLIPYLVVTGLFGAGLILNPVEAENDDKTDKKVNQGCQNLDIYLTRHFQKATPATSANPQVKNPDPDLSEKGQANAIKLSKLPFASKLDAAFFSQFKRTKQSVLPIIESYKIEGFEYDARDNQKLVDVINQEFCGKSIIIAGHSNTIPKLAQDFGAEFSVEFAGQRLQQQPSIFLSESDYGLIFHVEKKNGELSFELIDLNTESNRE